MAILHTPESARFYHGDGKVALEVPSADGKKQIKPDVRHARKFHLFPSFSNIKDMIAKPHIVTYKIEQALLTMIATPREQGESDEDYMRRIHHDSTLVAGMAADRGTEIHAQLKECFTNGVVPADPACKEATKQIETWMHELNIEATISEESFVASGYGYAGTIDLRGIGKDFEIIADYKSCDLKKYRKPYWENGLQLICYKKGVGAPPDTRLFTIPIDRETGECRFIEWNEQAEWTQEQLWIAWQNICQAWFIQHKHDPRRQ